MRILRDIGELRCLGGPLNLAIGVFDGVHRGHAAVIGSAVSRGGEAVVLTFDPHPVRVLRPAGAPKLLCTLEHKLRLASALGAGGMLVVEFDDRRACQGAGDFVREVVDGGNVGSVAVGAGFRFGKGRAGDLELLSTLGAELGFHVDGVAPVRDSGGEVISSTRVRTALDAGDLALVSDLLGRPYSLFGTVLEGDQLGRKIGYPTANLSPEVEQLPPTGVYAVRVDVGGERRSGVANLGLRPTVEQRREKPLLEVHLFDYDTDIYGAELEVHFVSLLRGEQRFDGVEALQTQIGQDVLRAREVLS